MTQAPDLHQLSPEQLQQLAAELLTRVEQQDAIIQRRGQALRHSQALNEKLTYELALLKRHHFARRSEQLNALQVSLLDEVIDADITAIEAELATLEPESAPAKPTRTPKRTPLPPELPRTLIHHEPDNTQCRCGCQLKRIGEDVSEKLDYTPGTFTVERHIRGKWVCGHCDTLIQAPVPAHVIDKGLGPRAWEDVLETAGSHIDIVKLGWGTAYVTDNLRAKLDESALYGGAVASQGPRYCPSIEDKIVRFGDRDGHQIFLEPDGLDDSTVYPNGISTSLPEEVQLAKQIHDRNSPIAGRMLTARCHDEAQDADGVAVCRDRLRSAVPRVSRAILPSGSRVHRAARPARRP